MATNQDEFSPGILDPASLERLQEFLAEGDHPGGGQLRAYVRHELKREEEEALVGHLETCGDCAEALKWLAEFKSILESEAQRRRLGQEKTHWLSALGQVSRSGSRLGTRLYQNKVVPVPVRPDSFRTALKNKVGIPVRKQDFLERVATKELWHLAERGHVLMLAPRRVGKTSLLCHMEDAPQDGWKCLFLSVESVDSEGQFVARLLETLSAAHPDGAWKERFGANIRKFLKGVGQIKAEPMDVDLSEALKDEWRDIGTIAVKALQEVDRDTLVLIDEFPIFIRNLLGNSDVPEAKHRTKLFLDWFRSVRNDSVQGRSRVHFVLTGSLGLDYVVKAANLSGTINDLDTFTLGPLEPTEARELLRRLCEGEGLPLPESVQNKILERIDSPVPYYLQLLFREILCRAKFHQRAINENLVDEAYESLLSADKAMYFVHWKERLDDPFLKPQERDLRRALLQAAAMNRAGLSPVSIVQISVSLASDIDANAVLHALKYDGYLRRDGDRWRFTSSLLRDWWRRWQVKETA